jgi:hypothetical protein
LFFGPEITQGRYFEGSGDNWHEVSETSRREAKQSQQRDSGGDLMARHLEAFEASRI